MTSLFKHIAESLERYRLRLTAAQAEGFLAFLGLLSGVAVGTLIVAFRYAIEFIQNGLMPALPGEAFEWLDPFHRFALPAAGGLVLGVAY